MHLKTSVIFLILVLFSYASLDAQDLGADFYQIGNPTLIDYYVDPQNGNNNNNGTTRTSPKRTVTEIWNSIPQNQEISTGVRINLLPGSYGSSHLPNYWENRTGTSSKPIIIRALDGFGTVNFSRDINMAGVSYFYLLGVTIENKIDQGYGDAFHCERCDHILLRGNSFNGAVNGRNDSQGVAHETIKFNQSQYIYIENNNIQGADDNGIDWVAVQYGHIRGNRIHDTSGWCAYVKGGSSYILIESNIAYECGEGGITVGQGTGFEFMSSPWIRYEANYVKVVNNIIYNIQGAALGVNGGFGVLLAHNTAYKTGSRSHLLEIVFGERSCDGDTAACATRQSAGGWGPTQVGSDYNQPIGNRDVVVANNLFYNPSGFSTGSQHFAIYGPRTPTATGIPSPQNSDTGLSIKGNVVWNGTNSMPVGVEESDQGCQSGNPTCTLSQLVSENSINSFEPDFIGASSYDFRPASGGTLAGTTSATIRDQEALDSSHNPINEGERTNLMVREFSGASANARPPGALVNASSSVNFPENSDGGSTPNPGDQNQAPTLKISKASAKKSGKKVSVSVQATVSDSGGISGVSATVLAGSKELSTFSLDSKGSRYSAKKLVKTKVIKLTIRVTATDSTNASTTKQKSVTIQ